VTLLIATAALAGTGVADYFPLKEGTKWHYHETGSGSPQVVVDEALPAVQIGGKPSVPVETRMDGRSIEKRYYRIDGDTVYLVAYDAEQPLSLPIPILKLGDGRTTWTYAGKTMFLGGAVPLEFKAQAVPKGKRDVLGSDRECVEVTMEARIDGGGGMAVVSRQVSLFAAGVGLVEMKQRQTVAKNTSESTTKLVRIEAGT